MKKVEIKLSQPIVAPLLDFVKPIAEDLRDELVFPPSFPDVDPEFQEAWKEELIEAQGADSSAFMALFDRDFFETGNIVINESNANGVLRGTAAIRHKLRADFLNEVSDEVLEKGDAPFESMNLREQQGYACYLFLATIQEIVIQHLDFVVDA
jgi:hypothetical protein